MRLRPPSGVDRVLAARSEAPRRLRAGVLVLVRRARSGAECSERARCGEAAVVGLIRMFLLSVWRISHEFSSADLDGMGRESSLFFRPPN